jgi:hypothetical protein
MVVFSRLMYWSIALFVTFIMISCSSGGTAKSSEPPSLQSLQGPPQPSSQQSSLQAPPQAPEQPSPQPSLSDCLSTPREFGPGEPSDPLGQGRDQLGFGFVNGGTFAPIDRFDVNRITSSTGASISNVEIQSHALRGVNAVTTAELRLADWTDARLVGQIHCTNPELKGKTRDVTVRIRATPRPKEVGALEYSLWTTYQLELELGDGRPAVNACRDPGDVAFPIAGYWKEDGRYTKDSKQFSFACTRRSAASCLEKGLLDTSKNADTVSLFEACIRMARADYCGDGESYTKHGSFVTLWDNRNIVTRSSFEALSFEAAWDKDGMVCSARTRWNASEIAAPSCPQFKTKPRCVSAADAMAQFPGRVLLFNESCATHPCQVIKQESFPVEDTAEDGIQATRALSPGVQATRALPPARSPFLDRESFPGSGLGTSREWR